MDIIDFVMRSYVLVYKFVLCVYVIHRIQIYSVYKVSLTILVIPNDFGEWMGWT